MMSRLSALMTTPSERRRRFCCSGGVGCGSVDLSLPVSGELCPEDDEELRALYLTVNVLPTCSISI